MITLHSCLENRGRPCLRQTNKQTHKAKPKYIGPFHVYQIRERGKEEPGEKDEEGATRDMGGKPREMTSKWAKCFKEEGVTNILTFIYLELEFLGINKYVVKIKVNESKTT